MTKALFKKQMMEIFAWLYYDRKSGKNRGKNGIIGYSILYLFLFGFLGFIFWKMADMLCAPLLSIGFGWLYMGLMSLVGIALAVFGSVFNTFSSLYLAKDNDLLLSMPIKSSKILLIRLSGVYAIGLMYELLVMIPAIIVFLLNAELSIAACIFNILLPFILSVFVLTLSCVLGYVVAIISVKLKRKNIITVVLSLAFITAYYYVYSKAYSMLQSIIADPAIVGNKVKSILYPFYQMGLGCEGNILSMLIFIAFIAVLFGIVYLLVSHSFLKIATSNKGSAKAKYKEKSAKAGSVKSALLKKELHRFLGSPTYMLNCGLGIVVMLIAAVVLLIKGNDVSELLNGIFGQSQDAIALLSIAAVCMMTTMNDITAPSISLEGKDIWIVQSLPVKAADVLMSKLKLNLYLSVIPSLILTFSILWIIRPEWYFCLLMPIAVVVFITFMAITGLFLNLNLPNLHWTNETIPVKQGMSVMIALFGGWAVVLLFGGIYFAISEYITSVLYLIIIIALLLTLSVILLHWLKTKGTKIFETLS